MPEAGDALNGKRDPLGLLLEAGLVALVMLAPLPFGAVGPKGRLALELFALALAVIWAIRAFLRETPLPPKLAVAGIAGLLALAFIQAAPLGTAVAGFLSPKSIEVYESVQPPASALQAETRILGADPTALEPVAALSVDPTATASALRTGVALAALLLVATTVVAARGATRLAVALLISAGFQGLYGLVVLISGFDHIWHIPKKYCLDSATGTFVNRNHFACYMAMSLACGIALVLKNIKAEQYRSWRRRIVGLLSGDNPRNLLLALLVVVGLAGLLTSLSRAGIALGLLAVILTILGGGRVRGLKVRLVVALMILSAAAVPLIQVSADQLVRRYAETPQELIGSVGRATVWGDSLGMVAAFPLAGTGYGTFASAYPFFRSPEIRLLYKHAHNDLLQSVVEGGIVGTAFVILLMIPVLRSIAAGISGRRGTLAVGFAAGLIVFLLHSLIDFNLHIPANAATAAIIAGTLLGLSWKSAA
jgi:O-antigen ligase